MTINHTSPIQPDVEKPQENHPAFFPDKTPPESDGLQHYSQEFKKISLLRNVPTHQTTHSNMEPFN